MGWLFLLGGAGCAAADEAVLRVGDQQGILPALFTAAGQLNGASYKIEWAEFQAGAPLLEALKAHAIDVGIASDVGVIFASAHGPPIRVIGAITGNAEVMSIVTMPNSPIQTIADLQGKTIAVLRGSPAHLLVLNVFRHAGIPLSPKNLVFLSPADGKAALIGGLSMPGAYGTRCLRSAKSSSMSG